MENNLLPEGYEDEVVLDEDLAEEGPVGYRNGIAFGQEAEDFKRDGMNKLLDSDGIESWKSWCVNCLSTQRYAHLAYTGDFGIDTDAVFQAQTREEAESILVREITEAVLADPYGRAAFIEEIEFDWTADDAVAVSVTIRGIDDVSVDVLAYITKGA